MVVLVTNMPSFRFDPYLWIHLAGVAALPIFLELCVLGLGMGDPFLPTGLEWLLVGIAGIAPILWMQWEKPFCIFSLVALALKPDHLTESQRRILRLFKAESGRVMAIATAVIMALVLWQIYRIAPLVAVPGLPQSRLLGLFIASGSFLFANLFLQVPASVVRVLLTSEPQFAATLPCEAGAIARDFTLIGIRVRSIVPPLTYEEKAAVRPRRAAQKISPDLRTETESPGEKATAFVSDSSVAPDIALDSSPWDEEVTPDLTEPLTTPPQVLEPSSEEISEAMSEKMPLPDEIHASPPDEEETPSPAIQDALFASVESSLEDPFLETIVSPEPDDDSQENVETHAEDMSAQPELASVFSELDAGLSPESDEIQDEHQNVTGSEEG